MTDITNEYLDKLQALVDEEKSTFPWKDYDRPGVSAAFIIASREAIPALIAKIK